MENTHNKIFINLNIRILTNDYISMEIFDTIIIII